MKQAIAYVCTVVVMALSLLAMQYQTADRLRSNQISACARGNILRATLANNVSVYDEFMLAAQNTRQASADEYGQQGDKVQYQINQDAADYYKLLRSRLKTVPQVDCLKIIK